MSLRLNRNLFFQTGADSAELGMLGSVVHPAGAPGDYHGTVYRGDQAIGEFTLHVAEESSPLQVQIDLAAQMLPGGSARDVGAGDDDCGCDDKAGGGRPAATYTVGRGGYVAFHVSSGTGGYSVQLAGPGATAAPQGREGPRPGAGGEKGKVWSSRELQKGDLFAVTLLRPGTYSVSTQRGQQGKLRLMYPERGKTAYRPPDPTRITVSDQGLQPADFELQPIQGQVYEIQAPSRITIALVEPEDREQPPNPDKARPARYTLRRRTMEPGLAPRDANRPNA